MTTLPERPDGGVDTTRFYIAGRGIYGPMFSMDLARYTAMIEAYTLERCAHWHDKQRTALLRRKIPNRTQLEILACEIEIRSHSESAAAFRKMEP